MKLQMYDIVRVMRIDSKRPPTKLAETGRSPHVNDTGTVVYIAEDDLVLTVESVGGDGRTLWLAEFGPLDLELMQRAEESSPHAPDVEAEVQFLRPEEGGRSRPARRGYRPAHKVREDYLTTGMHWYVDRLEAAPGESVRTHITFITPEVYPGCLAVGDTINVQEGGANCWLCHDQANL